MKCNKEGALGVASFTTPGQNKYKGERAMTDDDFDDDDLETEIDDLPERQRLAVQKAIEHAEKQGYINRKYDEEIEKFAAAVTVLFKLTVRATWPVEECARQSSKDELEKAIGFLEAVLEEVKTEPLCIGG